MALVYDFDGTLIEGNMTDQGLLEEIGWKEEAFWEKSNGMATENDADKICAYMHMLRVEASRAGKPITKNLLRRHGEELKMREGLAEGKDSWFDRADAIARDNGLRAKHYVITSGLAEMVEACPVRRRFTKVFGSRYLYDTKSKEALGPAQAVNYTTKTQHLFRINKGVHDITDDKRLNEYMPEEKRPVPFANMMFIGDGYTDIPCFRLVKQLGGHSVAVLDGPASDEAAVQIENLVSDGRVDHISLGKPFAVGGRLGKVVAKVAEKLAERAKAQ